MNTVLVIAPNGENLGAHTLEYAERIASERFGLDLVEVRPNVYKIVDLGKLKYEASKRKQAKAIPIKEMKFKLNIGDHDFKTKIGHILRFLNAGSPVRVTIWFSGREVSRPEAGVTLMNAITEAVGEAGIPTINPTLNGRNMNMSFEPRKK